MNAELQAVPDERVITIVPPEAVPMEWEEVYEILKPAVDRSGGRWSMTALLGALCRGERNLWIIKEGGKIVGAATSQFAQYPMKIVLSVQFLGGKGFDEWGDEFIETLEHFARDSRCSGVEAAARFGFWPTLKRRDWSRDSCFYDIQFGDSMNG